MTSALDEERSIFRFAMSTQDIKTQFLTELGPMNHIRRIFLGLLVLLVVIVGQTTVCGQLVTNTNSSTLVDWCNSQMDDFESLYRDFHQHPELSFQEKKTAARFANELTKLGAGSVTTNVGGFGVVAVIKNGDGPTLLLRADLDGLPVTEKTNLVYASKEKQTSESGTEVGVMHACGHDIHMTNLLGTARYLSSHRDAWSGTLVMIGQPAEERGAGAKAMLKDGLFEKFPLPDFALALHVDASSPTGKISYLGGFQQANVDSVDITVKGRGGHGAYPHATIDPIVQAAQLVLALQTIVSREVDPVQPAVVTVGAIHGGSKHNVIDDTCHLQLTVRSYAPEVRKQLIAAIKRIANGVAETANAPKPNIKVTEGTPSLLNDPALAARLLPVFKGELGDENVLEAKPSMGGEDFSRYGKAGVPILMFRLGAVNEQRLERFKQLGQPAPSLHSPFFYPDTRDALSTGIRAMTAASLHLLKKN